MELHSKSKTNKNIFGLKKEDVMKDLLELKNTIKNSKIITMIMMIKY